MAGSKNIRVFNEGFGFDTKSLLKESEICSELAKNNTLEFSWSSDFTSFWINERSFYYNHICDQCNKVFNYPVLLAICPVCNAATLISSKKWIGRIASIGEKEFISAAAHEQEVNPFLLSRAKEDLAANPIHEEGFDWEHLKNNS